MRHLVATEGQVVGTREHCEVSAAVTELSGAGITISWGCADEVTALLMQSKN